MSWRTATVIAAWLLLPFLLIMDADAATVRSGQGSMTAHAYRASADTLYVDIRLKGKGTVTVFYAGCVTHRDVFGEWFGCGQERQRRVRLRGGRARVGLWVQRLEHRVRYDISRGPVHWTQPAVTGAARVTLGGRSVEVRP